mmetsp:Transcript_48108/g.112477  ORF Transcript_48108/g.112477 Transcript_48108/m.112477 type:complete len:217 (-) Transcript_48108:449-1099(-)
MSPYNESSKRLLSQPYASNCSDVKTPTCCRKLPGISTFSGRSRGRCPPVIFKPSFESSELKLYPMVAFCLPILSHCSRKTESINCFAVSRSLEEVGRPSQHGLVFSCPPLEISFFMVLSFCTASPGQLGRSAWALAAFSACKTFVEDVAKDDSESPLGEDAVSTGAVLSTSLSASPTLSSLLASVCWISAPQRVPKTAFNDCSEACNVSPGGASLQ